MAPENNHPNSIEQRIHDLEQTISERQEQLKQRAHHLKDDLHDELAPEEIVRKYPLQAAAASLAAGFLAAKAIRAVTAHPAPAADQPTREPSQLRKALGDIGTDLLYSGKDLALSYLRYHLDRKIKPE